MSDKKQLKLNNFCKEYDIPRTTALQWVHSESFPAYKICGHWYVDVEEFRVWREKQHRFGYKYA